MGWFKNLFGKDKTEEEKKPKNEINQGIGYMYLIMGLQVLFVLVIMGIMLFVGRIIATPWWVFAIMFLIGVSGCVYIYKKAKRKWVTFKSALQNLDLSDKNYEISIMGGMLTMRVEHNPRRMIEAGAVSARPPALPPTSTTHQEEAEESKTA
ncbi:MAG TPA: hypothetical protein ENG14_00320 [Thermodesulforhabdus norvegica]|uniref:Uncharacterized protein n=1 Tax=Thermodesulforhabdus norvegica TaxID=39841 RepID=A0A7C0WTM5_9BACT|nr:hypothetical protein [Thermodesulforhabdus norvegica]